MPDVAMEAARLDRRMWRLIWAVVATAILLGFVCLGAVWVAIRAVDTADSSRARASTRITQLQERIVVLEDRGLAAADACPAN